MASPDILKTGQVIAQYCVKTCIARTLNSQVYLVENKGLHKPVVLKIFAGALNEQSVTQFTLQAKIMLEFTQAPQLVNVMMLGFYNDGAESSTASPTTTKLDTLHRPFLVMPYYPQTLADIIQLNGGNILLGSSLSIIKALLAALDYMHSKGVLHLDIKPQNVYIDELNNAYLADFDNALVLNNSPLRKKLSAFDVNNTNREHALRLTPNYASPELCSGELNKNSNIALCSASDLYSIGMLWAHMLCASKLSFDQTNVINKHIKKGNVSQHFIVEYLDDTIPAWTKNLIKRLLSLDVSNRPQSANQCLQEINRHFMDCENNPTVAGESITLNENLNIIKKDIVETLLKQGKVDNDMFERLLYSIANTIKPNGTFLDERKKALNVLIEDCRLSLINEQNLSAWFAWINYIDMLYSKNGKALSNEKFAQILSVGRASRSDNPELANRVLNTMFEREKIGFLNIKRYILPLIIIVFVFVFLSSGLLPELKNEATLAHESNNPQSSSIDNLRPLSQSDENQNSGNQSAENHRLETQILGKQGTGIQGTERQSANIDQLSSKQGEYQLLLNEKHDINSLKQIISIQWRSIETMPNTRIFATEVSNDLYQACQQDGACRGSKTFTTAQKNTSKADLANHPKVNVSWQDINSDFIPWLNKRLNKKFSLPSLQQWKIYSQDDIQLLQSNPKIQCKNCQHKLSRQYVNVTMPVMSLQPNSKSLYHVFGNVQEWLKDCWQEASKVKVLSSIVRCDQAMVAGGSWMTTKYDMRNTPIIRLLKTARTPTTGFRLVEQVNQ